MAKMISFVNYNNKYYSAEREKIKNTVETNLLNLHKVVEDKSYLTNYDKAIEMIYNIYESITKEGYTLGTIIKQSFQGAKTKGIYSLIIQDAWDLVTADKPTDFVKYYNLVEDKEDILIEADEFGTKLQAFNTEVVLQKGTTNTAITTLDNKTTELYRIIDNLGVSGTYYFFKALLKVIAIAKQ